MEGKVLIIDDEESLLEVLSDCFIDENLEVQALPAVDDIVQTAKAFEPDAVILDYLLAGVNGGELCHEIKMSFPRLPVVIISAYPKQSLSLARFNCDKFIAKPFNVFELVDEVKLLIKNSRLGDNENSLHELKFKT
jgi:DNA-binding response OmpR family regulator